jgi:hypothetical protein
MLTTIQAAAIAKSEGMALADLRVALLSLVPTIESAIGSITQKIEARDYETVHASIANNTDAARITLGLCEATAVDARVPGAIASLFEEADRAGLARKDVAALFELMHESDRTDTGR